jgi:uncharacterized protein (TIGR03084 family)
MLEQARDFLDESRALSDLVAPLSDAQMQAPTLFKGWSVDEILRHLHFWNLAAGLSLDDADAFAALFDRLKGALAKGGLKQFEAEYLDAVSGDALKAAWIAGADRIAATYGTADPKARVAWAGPSMSVRSAITARLMETWAHGQAVWDMLGVDRVDGDRIRNIAVLGVNTFGWSFQCRGWDVPQAMPHVELTLPSGAPLIFGERQDGDRITGSATAFCQVVAQTRNVADTDLVVTGEVARTWMENAQCFAGPPETPPAPGVRRKADQATLAS